jgi:hypothetical protein
MLMRQINDGRCGSRTSTPAPSPRRQPQGPGPDGRGLHRPRDLRVARPRFSADSALRIADAYAEFDAEQRFPVAPSTGREIKGCECPSVLRGVMEPTTASCSARSARRRTRWAPAWSRQKAPARPTGATGGFASLSNRGEDRGRADAKSATDHRLRPQTRPPDPRFAGRLDLKQRRRRYEPRQRRTRHGAAHRRAVSHASGQRLLSAGQ